ncbi:MAG: TonB-dependent receptor domain-containing protein, partial [Blastocatellia bacterium]
YGRATFLQRPALPDEKRLQFVDNLSYTTGRHYLKFGGEINRASDDINNPANFGGSYSYSTALQYGEDLLNPAGRNYSSYQQSFGIPGLQFATTDYAVFGQDQWKLFKGLTLNYGLRYDYEAIPGPIAPNPAIAQTQHIHEDATDFGPRVGVAWDVRNDGKTVIRSGYGLYYGRTPNGTIFNALTQTGLTDLTLNQISLSLSPTSPGAPMFPNILSALPPGASGSVTVSRLDSNFDRPRIQEANFGVERQLTSNMSVTATFVYTKGDRLPVTFDENLPAPQFMRSYLLPDGTTVQVPFSAGMMQTAGGTPVNINLSRPNPKFGSINVLRSIGETWYKALFVELKRRFSTGFEFNVSYTLAEADNLSGSGSADGSGTGPESPFGGSNVQNQFALGSNRAPSPTDQRHRMVVSGIWNLPFTKVDNATIRGLANGWRLSGIFVAESGRPVAAEVSVPNLPFTFQGAQYNGFGGLLGQGSGGDRNIAPNIPRDSLYGDANYRIDLRVARDFHVSERFVVEVIGEGFNIFNRSNFNGFNTTLYVAQATTTST